MADEFSPSMTANSLRTGFSCLPGRPGNARRSPISSPPPASPARLRVSRTGPHIDGRSPCRWCGGSRSAQPNITGAAPAVPPTRGSAMISRVSRNSRPGVDRAARRRLRSRRQSPLPPATRSGPMPPARRAPHRRRADPASGASADRSMGLEKRLIVGHCSLNCSLRFTWFGRRSPIVIFYVKPGGWTRSRCSGHGCRSVAHAAAVRAVHGAGTRRGRRHRRRLTTDPTPHPISRQLTEIRHEFSASFAVGGSFADGSVPVQCPRGSRCRSLHGAAVVGAAAGVDRFRWRGPPVAVPTVPSTFVAAQAVSATNRVVSSWIAMTAGQRRGLRQPERLLPASARARLRTGKRRSRRRRLPSPARS
ncbi:hypothetical protein R1CP_34040 [Rhodococcus opacus]|uniref:Uncharacterized protein n=1 Tax=Rhodococcus opacus TaxID=37919 RepID=A0A1B1KFM4_RHOOP|nr:hypothetical protein R1CP_34040 [Rhodococcus opacus]